MKQSTSEKNIPPKKAVSLLTELLSNINIINGNDVNFDVLTNLTLTKIGGFSRNQIPANVPYTVKIILFDAELLIN